MNISQHQKLFLHGVLFHYLSLPDLGSDVRTSVEDIMNLLQDELLDADHSDDEEEDEFEESDDSDDDEDGAAHVEARLPLQHFKELPGLRVVTEDGDRNTLTFFSSNGLLCADLDSKGVLVESISDICCVTRGGTSLKLETHDGDVFEFQVSKFPVEWTNVLTVNKAFGI